MKLAITTAIRALTLASNLDNNNLLLEQRHILEIVFLDNYKDRNNILIPLLPIT